MGSGASARAALKAKGTDSPQTVAGNSRGSFPSQTDPRRQSFTGTSGVGLDGQRSRSRSGGTVSGGPPGGPSGGRQFSGSGGTLRELLQALGAKGAAKEAAQVLEAWPKVLPEVLRLLLGVFDAEELENGQAQGTLTFQHPGSNPRSGLGPSRRPGSGMALGWRDAEGFNMIGASGPVAAGFSVFAGAVGETVKLQMAFSDFAFEAKIWT
mmetsp:Transcript_122264/g.340790  ORF Transcript_122264/g.340790 Transcript_122264/m.340790 type:complete len:210 (+) Transcript_122264:75-704(+)|eukprot:CAMPEP_0179106592 /NCGR_PEP_ID=MMETSP0796-20121207/49572_1 /TAXON_ID=73915 /ORGANISM="Pyrodinium bahamense, Strain pbaha01" /LENGTH=209 /DNA_ID=CAMNT_0020804633 /DNA_START=57 /DNA_END=686 /DNA_ORIENTATION=-